MRASHRRVDLLVLCVCVASPRHAAFAPSGPWATATRSSATRLRPGRRRKQRLAGRRSARLRRAQRDRRVPGDRRGRRRRHSRAVGRLPQLTVAGRRSDRVSRAGRRSHRCGGPSDPDLPRALHARGDAVARASGCSSRDRPRRRSMRLGLEAGAAGAGERAPGPRRPADCRCAASTTRRSGSRSTPAADRRPASTAATIDGRRRRRDGERAVELEMFDFALPDENSMHAMLFYSSDEPELYHGRNLDAAYHRFAHRHRIELVHALRRAERRSAALGRFSGEDFTPRARLRRARRGVGQRHRARARSTGRAKRFDDRAPARGRIADAWMTFLRAKLPKAHHVSLHAGRAAAAASIPHIRALADNIHSNPGPGRALPIFVTHEYVDALDGAIDIWCTGPPGFQLDRVARGAGARAAVLVLQRRTAGRRRDHDRRAGDRRAREPIWAAFKHDVRVYFYWHAVHWRHNSQKQGERNQNVWADSRSRSTIAASRTSRRSIRATSTATAC